MTTAGFHVSAEAQALYDDVVAWRRHIHQYPEIGLACHETAAFVAGHLRRLGLKDIRTGVGVSGVIATIPGSGADDRVLLLRADMDALPVQEENQAPYRSRIAGAMHACGHDAHTAVLMGIASILAGRKTPLPGDVRLMFQPGEEGHDGAMHMIRDGALDAPLPDAALGLHVWNELPEGTVYIAEGPFMASADTFTFTIHGRGGHGAIPHLSVDPVPVAAQAITSLQTVVSRIIDPQQPAVLTIGSIQGGTAANIIPSSVTCSGTIRSFDAAVRTRMIDEIRRILDGVCAAAGATCDFSLVEGYPATVNDPRMTNLVRRAVARTLGEQALVSHTPTMGAEDMSYVLQRVPGAFFFVGSAPRSGNAFPHHHPGFDIREQAMGYGMTVLLAAIEQFFHSP